MDELSFGSAWGDLVGLGSVFLENQTETRTPTPDPSATTSPPVAAVDSSGKSMGAQQNPASSMFQSMPIWVWFVAAFVALLLLALLVKVF